MSTNYKISDVSGWTLSRSDAIIKKEKSGLLKLNIKLAFTLRKPVPNITGTFDFNYFKKFVEKNRFAGIEYGKWLTNVESAVYSAILVTGCYDLSRLTGIKSLGFDVLKISFGSRGIRRALAHFSPSQFYINIRRHVRGVKGYDRTTANPTIWDETLNYLSSSGIQSLAHEYGHFIDYFIPKYVINNPNQFASLTKGSKIETSFTDQELNDPNVFVSNMNKLMCLLMYSDFKQTELNQWYSNLVDQYSDFNKGYYLMQNEIFARYFETWISYKLQQEKVVNYALTKDMQFFSSDVYPPVDLIKKTEKYLVVILKELAKVSSKQNIEFVYDQKQLDLFTNGKAKD